MGKSKQKSMLIIVCERDIDVDFYSSYEEAYNAMLHDISEITQIQTEELEHFEKDFYGIYPNSKVNEAEAWANAPDGNKWDWKIVQI